MKWLMTTVVSTEHTVVLNKMIDQPDWDCNAVDFSVIMNGVEFKNIERVVDRLHDHFEKQNKRIEELEHELRLFNDIKDLVKGDVR